MPPSIVAASPEATVVQLVTRHLPAGFGGGCFADSKPAMNAEAQLSDSAVMTMRADAIPLLDRLTFRIFVGSVTIRRSEQPRFRCGRCKRQLVFIAGLLVQDSNCWSNLILVFGSLIFSIFAM